MGRRRFPGAWTATSSTGFGASSSSRPGTAESAGYATGLTQERVSLTATTPNSKPRYLLVGGGPTATPRVAMDCPEGPEFQPDYVTPIALPWNVLLPKTGRLTATTYTNVSNGVEVGHTTFSIVVKKNGTATGSVVREEQTTGGV